MKHVPSKAGETLSASLELAPYPRPVRNVGLVSGFLRLFPGLLLACLWPCVLAAGPIKTTEWTENKTDFRWRFKEDASPFDELNEKPDKRDDSCQESSS
jgi:hypothetical protein